MTQMCPGCSQDNPDGATACWACGEPLRGLLAGNTLLENRYRLVRVLGCGGMGAVYLADDTRVTGRQVAIKENLNPAPPAEVQFETEMALMVSLRHYGLPGISDAFRGPNGRQYLVMEYVPGENLKEAVERRGPFAEAEALELIGRILEILSYLHGQRVIHRDVKPANIKLTPEGRPVLVDFGIAKLNVTGLMTQAWAHGAVSYGYAPIEQYCGSTDARSDLYSAGAVLYFLLTGQAPPAATDLAAGTPLTPPRRLRPDLSSAAQTLVFTAMALNPDQRYQSASAMQQAIFAAAAGGSAAPSSAVVVVSTSPALQPTVRTSGRTGAAMPTWSYAVAGAVVLLGLWLAVRMSGGSRTPTGSPPPAVAPVVIVVTVTPVPGGHTATPEPGGRTATPPAVPSATRQPAAVESAAPLPAATFAIESGGRIAFYSERDGNPEVYLMNADGSDQQRLTHDPADDLYPALSPDGSRIAFVSLRDGNAEIYAMDADGGALARLTNDPGEDRLPAWSADGKRIVFNSARGGSLNLYAMDPDGKNLVRLTSGSQRDGHASWSSIDDRIAYNSGQGTDTWEILVLASESGRSQRLTNNGVIDWSPAWSPDGQRILYLSKPGGTQPVLMIMDADGSGQRVFYSGLSNMWGNCWSPDGRYVALTSDQSGRDEIYVLRTDDGQVRQLTIEGAAYPSWSR